jgi:hypothetical protein
MSSNEFLHGGDETMPVISRLAKPFPNLMEDGAALVLCDLARYVDLDTLKPFELDGSFDVYAASP